MLDATEDSNQNATDSIGKRHNADKGLSKAELMAQSVGVMAAGYETTSVLLHFALYHIAMLPEVQGKLHEEVDAVVGASVSHHVLFLYGCCLGAHHVRAHHQYAVSEPSDLRNTALLSARSSVIDLQPAPLAQENCL